MAANTQTLNQLDKLFHLLALANKKVKAYGFGPEDNMDSNVTKYPIMWFEPVGGSALMNQYNRVQEFTSTFNVYCLDKEKKAELNQTDVLSDTEGILRDFLTQLMLHPYLKDLQITVIGDARWTTAWQVKDPELSGHIMELNLSIPNRITLCDVPQYPITGWTFSYNGTTTEYRLFGPTGPQGPIGPQGPQGDKGDQGNKGDNGQPSYSGELYMKVISPGELLKNADEIYLFDQWDSIGYITDNMDASIVDSSITIGLPGLYSVSLDLTFNSVINNSIFTFYLFVNGIQNDTIRATTKITNNTDIKAITFVDVNQYNSGDIIDIRVSCNKPNTLIIPYSGNFNVFSIGGISQGPQGEQGIQGEIGPQGPQGDIGPTGPAGEFAGNIVSDPITGDGVNTPLSLNYNTDFILNGSNALSLSLDFTSLPTLSIARNWNIFKNDNVTPFPSTLIGSTTVGSQSTSSSLTVPTGCKVNYGATATVAAIGVGQQAPTSMTGNWTWTPNPPLVFPATSYFTTSATTTTTYTVTESKPKSGLIVSGSQVIRATGNDTSSASDTITFNDVFIWGYTSALGSGNITQGTADTISAANIQALGTYRFGTKSQTLTPVTDSAGNRLVIAYLATAGNLSNAILNGSTSIIGAFLKRTSDVSLTTISGLTATYRVYVAVADNSYPGTNTIVFS